MTPIHLRAEYRGIEVPVESKWHQLVHISPGIDVVQYYIPEGFIENKSYAIELPPGSWEIVCLSKEVTDSQCVEIAGVPTSDVTYGWNRDFFHSLLRSKGLPEQSTLILKKLP